MSTILFAVFGVVLVASSLAVILHKNPVTSALFLVLGFCSLAGIYLVLQAEFLGLVQVIVYAGAIMVLFLFVIMYLNLGRDFETGVQILVRRSIGWAIGAVLLLAGAALIGNRWAIGPPGTSPPGLGNTQAIGNVLYTRYLFPFEITSIVLLVAMVGAVVLTRGGVTPKPRGGAKAARAAQRAGVPPASPLATPASGAPLAEPGHEPVGAERR